MSEPILVVDVGTSITRAALVVDGQVTLLKEPASGLRAWPASVCLADDGYLVGTAAEIRKRTIPGRYIEGPRRAVDAQAAMRLEHREVTGAEALTAYLAVLATEARQLHGGEIPRLLLTVPAEYPPGDPRREIMIGIGEANGFQDVELISDAVATALDPQTTEHLTASALVLVCDLGATWTTAMVQVNGSQTTQLAQETCAAGRDLDAQLINDLRTQGRTWLEPLLAAPGDAGLRAYYEAIDFMRRLKHQLGDGEEVTDHFTPVAPPYRLTRVWLEAFAEPALRWLAASSQRVMTSVGATPATVAAVVLGGGGARLPMTAATLHRGLGLRDLGGAHGRALRRSAEPELAAVRGAARFAAEAPTRVIPAERPRWRVRPVSWEIPGGEGRLLRWTLAEGRAYPAGAVLAQVRTTDERVFELTADHDGALLGQHVGAGQPVGPALIAAVAKDPATLLKEPPARRHHLESDGSWLLTTDRQHLVECDRAARAVRFRTVADATPVAEFHPDHGGSDARGRVFLDPSGHLCLIAWDGDGFFSVWDIETGKLTARFRDPGIPVKVLVNEAHWRLAVESRGKGVGRFRPVTTFWDLRTGTQIAKVTDEQWRLHEPGYSSASLTQAFSRSALSPDGQLRAIVADAPDGTPSMLLTEAATDRELFTVHGAPRQRAWVAFSGEGRHLLANWESDERSLLDVWEV